MGAVKRRPSLELMIWLGALGAVVGMVVSQAYPALGPGLFMLAGFSLGTWLAWLISRWLEHRAQDPDRDAPHQHYRLRKDLRDSYYTDLIMKKIIKEYHAEDPASDDGESPEDEDAAGDMDEPGPGDDPFSWANDLRDATADESSAIHNDDLRAGQRHAHR